MKKIDSLTSLRFFMVMLIVFSHFEFLQRFHEGGILYGLFLKYAYFPVDFFFILSGFGMMFSFCKKGEVAERLSVQKNVGFAVRHVRKIYKVYAVTMIICLPLYCFLEIKRGIPIDVLPWFEIHKIIMSIPLLQSALGLHTYSHTLNGVAWFLSSLFCIYLISPFFLQLFSRIKSSRMTFLSPVIAFFCIIFARLLLRYIENNSVFDDLVYGSPYCRLFYVILGMLVARLFICQEKKIGAFIGSGCEVTLILFVFTFVMTKNTLAEFALMKTINLYISIVLSCLLCFVFAFQNGCVSQVLQHKKLKTLGEMSMYIFLIHYPIRGYLDAFARFAGFKESQWIALLNIVVTLSITFLISSHILKKGKNRVC